MIADGRQYCSVRPEGSPVCAQGDVTEEARLPLTPQLAQHVGAVQCHRLGDTISGTQLLGRRRHREKMEMCEGEPGSVSEREVERE